MPNLEVETEQPKRCDDRDEPDYPSQRHGCEPRHRVEELSAGANRDTVLKSFQRVRTATLLKSNEKGNKAKCLLHLSNSEGVP